jgi:WD40 repeat protein
MFGIKVISQGQFRLHWQAMLSDYVNAIAWSADGQTLAASSALGEVVLVKDKELIPLRGIQGDSVDCLAFSHDNQFLAAGGQKGQIVIWQRQSDRYQQVETLEHPSVWIDQLAWSPTTNHLAFSMGQYVQVWNAQAKQLETNLSFEASSILGMAWHPSGEYLALSGYQGIKVWSAQDWFADPQWLEIPSASIAIAWSPDGKYLASGNLDRTLLVWEWGIPHPWQMQGFPGKVRQLAWSDVTDKMGVPLLATCSAEGIVVWEKDTNPAVGWRATVLEHHSAVVQAIAFQPGSFLLTSASADGRVGLWRHAKQITQILEGALDGFTSLAWHPQGHQLAAGGKNGEFLIWVQETRGQGFRKS